MTFSPTAARQEFPILARTVNNKPLIYFDNAASAQKPTAVINAMRAAMEGSYANVHRGLHTMANETTDAFENARATVARFLNAPSPDQIVFTKGATEAINLVAAGLGPSIKPGDEIILSVMEHHANIVPWHFLREKHGAVLRWLDISAEGEISLEALDQLIGPNTRLLTLTAMSNVFGAMLPLQEIIACAHAKGVPVLLDACQAAVHAGFDVQALDVDFAVISAHKLYGPTGIGALYGKAQRLAALPPYQGGGEMIDIVTQDRITYAEPPHRFEAGTPPILEAIGFGAALTWLMSLDRQAISAHETALGGYLIERLRGLNDITLYGGTTPRSIITFTMDATHPHDVAQILDRYGIAVRAGHHCAQPLMARLGVTATARASLALYNTHEEVDAFVEALTRTRALLT